MVREDGLGCRLLFIGTASDAAAVFRPREAWQPMDGGMLDSRRLLKAVGKQCIADSQIQDADGAQAHFLIILIIGDR